VTERWIDSLNCRLRLVIVCHNGSLARNLADRIVGNGYPADSVFYGGYNQLPSSRRPATDTLPLAYLGTGFALPQDLSARRLWAVILSKRNYKLVDVRGPSETAGGLIPGACNIVWPDPFQTSCLSLSRTADIILNCASGHRAGLARDFMLSQGYDSAKVVNFGAYSIWDALNGPVSHAPSPDCQCVGIEHAPLAADAVEPIGVEPNPFNPTTVIRLNIPSSRTQTFRNFTLEIFSMSGKKVAVLAEGPGFSGQGEWTWNATGLPSGIYLLKARIGGKYYSRKMIFQK
jgi:rhodanese-related sulfurtransferase